MSGQLITQPMLNAILDQQEDARKRLGRQLTDKEADAIVKGVIARTPSLTSRPAALH